MGQGAPLRGGGPLGPNKTGAVGPSDAGPSRGWDFKKRLLSTGIFLGLEVWNLGTPTNIFRLTTPFTLYTVFFFARDRFHQVFPLQFLSDVDVVAAGHSVHSIRLSSTAWPAVGPQGPRSP